jgi:phospholipid/cholesterol/gamma-HCH transport system substrate-binding protein
VPTRKEIQWSQLRVGALVLLAMAVLVGLIFLMSGTTGGLFAKKIKLRAYFGNAAGIKDGAPVTLEGVTIGNVVHVGVVPARNPTPVEVIMQIGQEYQSGLHMDSTASISQAGVLGDSYIDIDSETAKGAPPPNNTELKVTGAPSIQDVIRTSDSSIQQINVLMKKVEILVDTLNSKKGTAGEFLNDPALYNKISRIADNLETITGSISKGNGSLGKLMTDDTLYTRASSAIDRVNNIVTALDEGKGTAGKLLHDETLYNNLNATVNNTNQLVADINAGKGSIGLLAKDPAFSKKLDDTVTRLDSILKNIDEGKGTVGQLFENRAVYDHLDNTLDEAHQLVKGMRENPKKYLVIQLKVF